MITEVAQSRAQTANTVRNNAGRRMNKPRNRNLKKQVDTGDAAPDSNASPANDNKPETADDGANEADASTTTASTDGHEPDVCWICAEPVKFYSLSECNHRTCHVCALRLRALYKKTDCTFCKHPQELVIFTASPSNQFDDFKTDEMPFKDSKLFIIFETQEMMEESLILLRFNCPDSECPFIAKGWNDLKAHVRGAHGKQLCDLCIRLKRVFAHEHTLYTFSQLQMHLPSMRRGRAPDREKEVPEGGTHPLCEFCKECYFSDDELFSHMREKHEECFICKRQGIRDQYFLDYANLESHFNTAHHPCTRSECREQKFVVFGSLMDLKAHMVEVHGAAMSAKDMKEARRLETNFEFNDNRGSGARRRERDADRNSDREPPRTNIQQARPPDRRREGFGVALTGQDALGSSTPVNGRSSPLPSRDIDPETARRHAAFMARVASLSSNSSAAETSVRSAIRSFRASESSARDLVSTFYNIVDRDLEATASLIVPLVDLLDDEDKRKELLESFNGFKIEQRQQFPDLVPGGQGSAYTGVASGRVLNVKHSTQPGRNAGQIWDRVARAATSSASVPGAAGPSTRPAERFPTLPRAASAAATPPNVGISALGRPQRSTPWASAASSATASPAATSSRILAQGSNRNRPAPGLSSAAFPSLPSAPPRTKPPMGGNKSLRNIVGNAAPSPNAWGAPKEDTEETQPSEIVTEERHDEETSLQKKGRKKGKEKQKVTLFTLGTFPT